MKILLILLKWMVTSNTCIVTVIFGGQGFLEMWHLHHCCAATLVPRHFTMAFPGIVRSAVLKDDLGAWHVLVALLSANTAGKFTISPNLSIETPKTNMESEHVPILNPKWFTNHRFFWCIDWVVPPPSNSQHQDCYIFSRGSQPKPSFATGILGGVVPTQGIEYIFIFLQGRISSSLAGTDSTFCWGYRLSLRLRHRWSVRVLNVGAVVFPCLVACPTPCWWFHNGSFRCFFLCLERSKSRKVWCLFHCQVDV